MLERKTRGNENRQDQKYCEWDIVNDVACWWVFLS
jgi:hypothetical protein